ncbi:hypothetical protein N2W20_000482 [Clostridium perfringens]|uniref:hypothetical protein n=1 Tax=Clostridium perfringens TaxID=1502 RepID=UPI0029F7782D|nr:hypothetical protein [Clostridium perfringens]EJT6134782.1 hypothetical protein [Clostridium perfringens]MDM0690992.1 hypothetical protein [Clostridium perfringens]
MNNNDFLIVGESLETKEALLKAFQEFDLEICNLDSIDIGSGCNFLSLIGSVVNSIPDLSSLSEVISGAYILYVSTGKHIDDFFTATKAYKSLMDKIKMAISSYFDKSSDMYSLDNPLYFKENFIISNAIMHVLNQYYDGSYDDIEAFKLEKEDITKIGVLGRYAIQNHGYSKESLEGSPEKIYYLVFKVHLKNPNNICDLITVLTDSKANIMYCKKFNVDTNSTVLN